MTVSDFNANTTYIVIKAYFKRFPWHIISYYILVIEMLFWKYFCDIFYPWCKCNFQAYNYKFDIKYEIVFLLVINLNNSIYLNIYTPKGSVFSHVFFLLYISKHQSFCTYWNNTERKWQLEDTSDSNILCPKCCILWNRNWIGHIFLLSYR